MPVPKRKTSKQRRNNRNANKNIAVQAFTKCNNCSEVILPHQACSACGFYRGRKVFETKIDRIMRRGEARKGKEAAAAMPEEATPEAVVEPEAKK